MKILNNIRECFTYFFEFKLYRQKQSWDHVFEKYV